MRLFIKNGSKGARTLGLPLVRRALIPAELCFHLFYYITSQRKREEVILFFYKGFYKALYSRSVACMHRVCQVCGNLLRRWLRPAFRPAGGSRFGKRPTPKYPSAYTPPAAAGRYPSQGRSRRTDSRPRCGKAPPAPGECPRDRCLWCGHSNPAAWSSRS